MPTPRSAPAARGVNYQVGRLLTFALLAGTVVPYVLLYRLLLWDNPGARHFGAVFWGVLAFGVLATAEGFRLAFLRRALPLAGPRRHSSGLVRHPAGLLVLLYLLCVVLLAPGVFLSGAVDCLHGRRYAELQARRERGAERRARDRRNRGRRQN
ncbi:hypothetical protein OG455_14705 [Kitasatospora sp. NBC_01287]|uniref:hypothetical protein n=1 Tax=Kitasatospora sp. NBC_01287 TaxID=2903573 RepID=UPI002259B4E5|nr:hypothetical protein [Kitasatospora sp. NBC_01287]MCX4746755.1 hypothetical protein [Kitasatospora sp. NBC_01287]